MKEGVHFVQKIKEFAKKKKPIHQPLVNPSRPRIRMPGGCSWGMFLERIREVTKDARRNLQQAINFVFTNYPPIRLDSGKERVLPLVSKLGEAKAIRKMIVSYHPDKIDKSDMRYKLLCEEITKVFTEMC